MYETAWQIRGYEQFLMDTIEHPPKPSVFDRIAEQNFIRALPSLKPSIIVCGDDVANQSDDVRP